MDKEFGSNKGIPKQWSVTTLADLFLDPKSEIVDGPFGSNLKASEYVDSGVPILRIQNIERNLLINKNVRYITPEKAENLERHSYRSDDIILTKLGNPLGKACIVPESFAAGIVVADLVRLRLNHEFLSKTFLVYAINSPTVADHLNKLKKGTTRPRINLGHVRSLRVKLPPKAEQHRIVAKIEELFSELDKGVENLKRARALLNVYRQVVLKHAFEGKLTAQWREMHSAIQWDQTTLGSQLSFLTSGSRGWAKFYAGHGDKFIRAQNLKHDRLDLEDIALVNLPDQSEGMRTRVHTGDLLITITGANVTKTAFVSSDIGTAYVSQHVALARPIEGSNTEFLYWYLVSEIGGRKQLTAAAYGAGKPGLNLKNIRSVQIPLPSAEEQTEIVSCIKPILSIERSVNAQIDCQIARSDSLRQSILKKAFAGQLVAQEPSDEPASAILDRIRAQKKQASKNGEETKRARKKSNAA